MMNLDQVINNFMNQPNALGYRMQQAVSYRDAAARGEISQSEYHALLEDLQRLEGIQLAADELDQQIAFNDCLTALKYIPLP